MVKMWGMSLNSLETKQFYFSGDLLNVYLKLLRITFS